MSQSLNILIMDPPYESSNTMTAFRIIESALKKKIDVTAFAFEGAVSLTFEDQSPHANPVKGTDVLEEKHPLTKDFVAGLFKTAKESGAELTWINCGFCVAERGAGKWGDGPVKGGPPHFAKAFNECDKTLVIATK